MLTENLELKDLFLQLGLANDEESIENFIAKHKGLDKSTKLEEASFWTQAQSTFIRQSFFEDAEWTELIDQLDNRLR
ncbi:MULTISPECIES: DUF2789 family protein [Aliiglaciecola]|uniref:DUF2789 family protein n=1 Tax=Aliiglaciecola TaxID=1406885 RepID=UPI001C0A59AD|nr:MULTISPECIES: DUF2789 family protein [Aliiglaciecola]MBU2877793.1 DUF2789 domain-containing protein [Aliiglaciecola lipolytica]MDO6709158.1 DUF2789 family protein [Aliiglaciecola sp. 2_MG-2023]MDO6750306.1 DUF2789 family protein [Aliiglaciecola sp. 1_MG-2023]